MSKAPIPSSRSLDWILLSSYLSLVIIGWLMLYAVVYDENNPYAFLDLSTEIGKQTAWMIISFFALIFVLAIDWKFWNSIAFFVYGFGILGLMAVLVLGKEINGAKAWFSFGGVSFQPAELAKFGTVLAVASYLSFHKKDVLPFSVLRTTIGIFTLPVFFIMLQPDAGSAMVFMSFFILMYRKGLSPIFYILAFSMAAIFIGALTSSPTAVGLVVAFLVLGTLIWAMDRSLKSLAIGVILGFGTIYLHQLEQSGFAFVILLVAIGVYTTLHILKRSFGVVQVMLPAGALAIGLAFFTQFIFDKVLKPHQQERINVWLNPEKCDPRGSLYNILQSKLAIGSGGLEGKGFLKGEMTKLKYVPEQTTDFIFSTVGEEQGFMGSVGVIVLFLLLLYRLVMIAEQSRMEFIKAYAYGVAGIIFFHFFINIGMAIGVMPVVGIPLPFLSKGGSSLLAFTVMIGIAIKMDTARYRT